MNSKRQTTWDMGARLKIRGRVGCDWLAVKEGRQAGASGDAG